MLTTSSSSSSSVTALTPYDVRPMARTSFSWKRIARPFFLARIDVLRAVGDDGLDQRVALLEQHGVDAGRCAGCRRPRAPSS